MQQHYFASDGNFGDATEIIIVDTDHWQPYEFEAVTECADSDRVNVARVIMKWQAEGRPELPDYDYDRDSLAYALLDHYGVAW